MKRQRELLAPSDLKKVVPFETTVFIGTCCIGCSQLASYPWVNFFWKNAPIIRLTGTALPI
jgi:hypothetical protein